MGLFRKIADIAEKIDYHISDDPQIVGQRFEDHVESLFSTKYFPIEHKTHSFKTNEKRYVESSLKPDFIFRYKPTGERFAVECKYRSSLNSEDMLEWSSPQQLQRYRQFEYENRIPVFIVIGLEGVMEDDYEGEESVTFMFNIPLNAAKYPKLYPSVFEKYERPYDKPFFWKNGVLY